MGSAGRGGHEHKVDSHQKSQENRPFFLHCVNSFNCLTCCTGSPWVQDWNLILMYNDIFDS